MIHFHGFLMNDWDARRYREHAGFVSELGLPVVALLDPRPGETILDLGCGDGDLTARLAGLGCDVVGIDASPDMVAAARGKGIDARVLDAVDLATAEELRECFDAVFSNAALHWMHPMQAVARGIARVLKPSGRLVAELGGQGNVTRIRSAIYQALESRGVSGPQWDPWYFPAPDEYSRLLGGLGFDIESVEHFERPTDLPSGITEWIESVARPFLNAVAPGAQREFLSDVEDRLAGALRRDDGSWWADYVRLRIRAVKRPAA